jgi:hypothetical protein
VKVRFRLGIGLANAHREEIREYADGTPQEEIDDDLNAWADNYINLSATVIEEKREAA